MENHSTAKPTEEAPLTPELLSTNQKVQSTALVPAEAPGRPAPLVTSTAPLRRSPGRLRLLLVGLLLLMAGGLGTWYWWNSGPPPLQYKTTTVDRGAIKATVTATGTVNPVISVQVGSQVTGKIEALYVDYNSVVVAGQVIAQIDPETYKARVAQARASLRTAKGNLGKAQADLDQHKIELQRMIELRNQEFVPQSDLDLARTNVRDADAQIEVAQAQVDQAKATLSSAELDLGYTTITSPVNGIVVSRNVDVGQTVAASLQAPTLFVIAQDLTRMQVDTNVSESDIGPVTEGKTAEFTVDAFPREPFVGTVVQVRNAPISLQNVVTYDVVINVDNRDLKLKPGMTANVSIVTAQKESVLRLPNAALRFKMPGVTSDRKKPVVWILESGKTVRAVPIKPGIVDALYTEVTEGEVREGDRAIVEIERTDDVSQKELPPGFAPGPRMR